MRTQVLRAVAGVGSRARQINQVLATPELALNHGVTPQQTAQAALAASFADRSAVYVALSKIANVLARLDDGETLWQVYQAIQEVEGWWDVPAS